MDKENYDKLLPASEGRKISKTRYEFEWNSKTVELDVYKAQLKGLITSEVEFKHDENPMDFEPPGWFGKEVTEDDRYKNKNLALKGLPERTL